MYFFRLVVDKFLIKEINEPFIFREELPFLWDEIRYMATNHFMSDNFVFSKIVPTRQEKLLLHSVQWNARSWTSCNDACHNRGRQRHLQPNGFR